jgi:hypothetical protein
MDLAVAGKNPDIDDFVEFWHENDVPGTLAEFLGMDNEEYTQWIRDPECLQEIINNYKFIR